MSDQPRYVALVIELTPGTPRLGLWCEACALPSLCELDFFELLTSGVRVFGTVRICTECGPQS